MYEPRQGQWSRQSVANSSELVLCRHTATVLPDHRSIFLLGGGMNCFGFGTTFSPPVVLHITSLVDNYRLSDSANAAPHGASDGTAHGQNPDRTLDDGGVAAQRASDSTGCEQNPNRILATDADAAHQVSDHTEQGQNFDRTLVDGALPEAKVLEPIHHSVSATKPTPTPTRVTRGDNLQGIASRGDPKAAASLTSGSQLRGGKLSQQAACDGHGNLQAQEASQQGLAVAKLQAKAAKDALKGLGWLDRSCRADTHPSSGVICLPLTGGGSAVLNSAEFSSPQPDSDPAMSTQPSSSQHGSAEPNFAKSNAAAEVSSAQLSSDRLSSAQHSSAEQLNDADASSEPGSSSHIDPGMASSQPLPTGEVPLTDGSSSKLKGSTVGAKGRKQKAVGSQEADKVCLKALMQAGLAVVQPIATSKSSRVEGGPAQRLKGAVTALLQQQASLTLMHCVSYCLCDTVMAQWYSISFTCPSPRCSRDWGHQLDMDNCDLCDVKNDTTAKCSAVLHPLTPCCVRLWPGLCPQCA